MFVVKKRKEVYMEIIFLFIAVIASSYVKGLCGFGNTLVFQSICGFFFSTSAITPIELMLNLPMNAIMSFRLRKKTDFKVVIPSIIFLLLGSIPGALFLKSIDESLLKIIFGIIIVAMGIDMIINKNKKTAKKPHSMQGVFLGLLSGLMCGLFGVGVLLAGYVSKISKDTETFKASACTIFLFDGIFRFILYSFIGLLTFETVKTFAMVFLFSLAFLLLGMRSAKMAKESTVKLLINIFLIFSGASLIITNI